MSVATSIPCIRLPSTTSSSSSTCSSTSFRLSYHGVGKPTRSLYFTVKSSQTEGPIRRPAMAPPPQPSPTPPSPPSPTPPSKPPVAAVKMVEEDKNVVTLEFQRAKAKELQEYFKLKKLEEADQGPAFGFVPKNEINNGRYIKSYINIFLNYRVDPEKMLTPTQSIIKILHLNYSIVKFG